MLTRSGRSLRDLLSAALSGASGRCVNSEGGSMRFVVIGCLCGGVLTAIGCADGRGIPTSPSATVAVSGSAATVPGPAATAAHPVLLLTKTCDAIDHCTVITSSSGPFPVGSDVNYFGPLLENRTTSRIRVTTPRGDIGRWQLLGELQNWHRDMRHHCRHRRAGGTSRKHRSVIRRRLRGVHLGRSLPLQALSGTRPITRPIGYANCGRWLRVSDAFEDVVHLSASRLPPTG